MYIPKFYLPNFYNDCDGVLFDTIDVALDMMKEQGCNMADGKEVDYYFRKVIDWNEVFRRAREINNGVEKFKILSESGYFNESMILTGLSGNDHEERLKRFIFGERLPGVRVITVQYGIPKALVISQPERGLLVDDEKRNCIKWEQYGGTAVLFSKEIMDLKNNIVNDIIDIPYTEGYKKLVKTRYF